MFSLRLVTPPAVEPVSLSAAKLHLRVEHDTDDALISDQIAAAREWAEEFVGEKFVRQTWEVRLGEWPEGPYLFPVRPVQEILGISFVGADSSTGTVPPESYVLSEDGVRLVPGASWPVVALAPGGVTIRAAVGIGETAARVPRSISQAILLLVGHWYANREAVAIGNIVNTVPLAVESLLWMFRRVPI